MKNNQNALPIGTRLDEYEIKKILGAGGFGVTYLAYDVNLLIDVVIKEYLPNYLAVRKERDTIVPISNDDKDEYEWGMKRFLEEAQTLASFKPRHENIVKIIRFFKKNNTAYFVMEHEDGEDLSVFLSKRQEKLSEKEVKDIILPILDGLKATHDNGILHRDIKPSNIFIRKDSTPILIDFGSARNTVGEKSKSLSVVVTPGYAPIEQYTSTIEQGIYTDIYSIGAVMYKLVTGHTPIESNDRSMSVYTNGEADVLELASERVKGEYSKSLLNAIDKAMSIRPKDRPQSIDELKSLIHEEEQEESEVTVRMKPIELENEDIFKEKKSKKRYLIPLAIVVFLLMMVFLFLFQSTVPQDVVQEVKADTKQEAKQDAKGDVKKGAKQTHIDESEKVIYKDINGTEKYHELSKEQIRAKILETENLPKNKVVQSEKELKENVRLCLKYYEKAKSLLYCQKGCDGGNALSCVNLGFLYNNGVGLEKDYQKAYEYYKMGCDMKSGIGCSDVGYLYQNGYGVKKDYSKASKYYKIGCDMKSGLGCLNLGFLHAKGKGVKKSRKLALKYYSLACKLDEDQGCVNMGYAHEKGLKGVKKSYEKAVSYYKKGCKLENGIGCASVGYMYEKGKGVTKNSKTAAYYYKAACSLRNGRGCAGMGYFYREGIGGFDKDYKKAMNYFMRSCNLKNSYGCLNVGYMYAKAKGVNKDFKKANKFYEISCDLKNGLGCKNLAYAYEVGRAVKKSESKAAKYYKKGCSYGVKASCEKYEYLR